MMDANLAIMEAMKEMQLKELKENQNIDFLQGHATFILASYLIATESL